MMSNQTVVEATITLKPSAVGMVLLLQKTECLDEETRWAQVAKIFPEAASYAKNDRADFIPFGGYGSLDPSSTLNGSLWEIHCSTGDKQDEVKAFLELLPTISDAVDLTLSVEGMAGDVHISYELVDGKMIETRRAREGEDRFFWL